MSIRLHVTRKLVIQGVLVFIGVGQLMTFQNCSQGFDTVKVNAASSNSPAAANTSVAATCGVANGVAQVISPSGTSLCENGSASQVLGGSGTPWLWNCIGEDNVTVNCSSMFKVNGACGSASGTPALSSPTSNLCSSGLASIIAGQGPWSWTCVGSGGGTTASCSDSLSIAGKCGSANNTSQANIPTGTLLCASGSASNVVGSGPWTWSCAGSNGGPSENCTANLMISGSCGSASVTPQAAAPTSNLCSSGAATGVTGTGPWSWSCAGSNGGSTSSCTAQSIVVGHCGSSNGMSLSSQPSTNLCSAGAASGVSGSGPWTWSCAGAGGGASANCSAQVSANGVCGSVNNTSVTNQPTLNLCASGTASSVNGAGPWSWTCTGSNGGTTSSCSAGLMLNGACGTSNGATASSIPTSNLCASGTATSVAGAGPWTWSCVGSGGGSTSSCSDSLLVNGSCGVASQAPQPSIPSGSNLCASGSASAVSGTGPWNWTCVGSNGGTTSSCAAPPFINGSCGTSDHANLISAPTTNLCSTGNATVVGGGGPWTWSCTGVNGGVTSSCSANVKINGTCGVATGTPLPTAPTSNLCATGSPEGVTLDTTTNTWTWMCFGENSGGSSICRVSKLIAGVCGTANHVATPTLPTSNLCLAGTTSPVTGTGPWMWSCNGIAGGASANCSANVQVVGSCGSANGQPSDFQPSANLCATGTASPVLGDGKIPWTWTCPGTNGGGSSNCSAPIPSLCGPGSGHTCSAIATGYYFSCAAVDGAAQCWGKNSYGEVGNNSTTEVNVPTQVLGLTSGVTAISIAGETACAIVSGGAQCWGQNTNGQLGNGSTTDSHVPVQVQGLTSGVTAISVGATHACAILGNNTWCWGKNDYGQLGNGTKNNSTVPVQVSGLSFASSISAGDTTSYAVTSGQLVHWGFGGIDASFHTVYNLAPVITVNLLSGVTKISSSQDHACAIVSGGVKCWGGNLYGQLGNGTTTGTNPFIPVQVSGLTSGVTSVSVGLYHTCAIMNGASYCWGQNSLGQLGINSTANSSVPVQVLGQPSGTQVIGGAENGYNSCSIVDGSAWCWGYNLYGQLGVVNTTTSLVPVQVH